MKKVSTPWRITIAGVGLLSFGLIAAACEDNDDDGLNGIDDTVDDTLNDDGIDDMNDNGLDDMNGNGLDDANGNGLDDDGLDDDNGF